MTSDPTTEPRAGAAEATGARPAAGRTDRGGQAEDPETEQVAMRDRFNRIADRTTSALGSFWALLASVLVVVAWAFTGPIFHFSDTWQLFINTTTTVVTFWMVFVIQNSQNRDAKAVHLKLDELIRAVEGARNAFITLENEPEEVVAEKAEELAHIASVAGDDTEVSVTLARRSPEDGSVESTRAVRRRVGTSRKASGRRSTAGDRQPRTRPRKNAAS